MPQKDAILFFKKLFENKDFQNELIKIKPKDTEAILLFAQENNFHFTKEQYLLAYKSNYKMRWMLHMGKKYSE